jgi:hypothetical protein
MGEGRGREGRSATAQVLEHAFPGEVDPDEMPSFDERLDARRETTIRAELHNMHQGVGSPRDRNLLPCSGWLKHTAASHCNRPASPSHGNPHRHRTRRSPRVFQLGCLVTPHKEQSSLPTPPATRSGGWG